MMPQLDTTTYLTQYRWTLITLFLLFSLLVSFILPTIKTNLLIRKSVMGGWAVLERGSELNKEVVSIWKHLD
uniref:ATP synthase F0 subunit 8 n=4 Tax=Schizopathidae TaxID=223214 RepID=A0A6M4RJ98_9CNID|nr:ATP synthase F0 subunit 8 [Bathypathes sp. n. 2 NB-2020]QJS34477.1 ATP synthase F0 subunit 8 [Bathypathes sp. n. 3 NB-2020]QJS34490.1 ATP synthase F0 subunit 8 [Bathypathes sp. 1 NB-2020]QJS34624.1 ATP synthase F0 subunit 8 [Stauropathes arctica]WRM53905.1 ATP synthase F0 subunit 8 [Bathypathes sp. 1 YY-2024]